MLYTCEGILPIPWIYFIQKIVHLLYVFQCRSTQKSGRTFSPNNLLWLLRSSPWWWYCLDTSRFLPNQNIVNLVSLIKESTWPDSIPRAKIRTRSHIRQGCNPLKQGVGMVGRLPMYCYLMMMILRLPRGVAELEVIMRYDLFTEENFESSWGTP